MVLAHVFCTSQYTAFTDAVAHVFSIGALDRCLSRRDRSLDLGTQVGLGSSSSVLFCKL